MAMTSEEQRISKLEGAYEQVDGRLGDLTLSFEALRTEMIRANEALRAEMNSRFNNLYMLLGGAWITVMGALIGLFLRG